MTTKAQKSRMSATKRADVAFSRAVRASGPCREGVEVGRHVCAGPLQAAHVHSRRYLAIRWDTGNVVPLCAGAHYFYTLRPLEWEQTCRRWGIDWDGLKYRALNDPPMNPADVLAQLKEAI